MVAHLDDASIDCVVNGPSVEAQVDMANSCGSWDVITSGDQSSSGGQQPDLSTCTAIVPHRPRPHTLTGCELAAKASIDHKRHHAARHARVQWPRGAPMFTWDFMLKRNDGTVCMIHPNWKDNKVAFYEGIPDGNLDVPRTGLGGSQARIGEQVTRMLKFDKSKTPPGVGPAMVQSA